jgi:hypothetical protein
LSIRIHRSLRRKTKTQIEALHTRTNSPSHCDRRKARTLSTAKKPQNRTRKTTTQNKREPPQTRKSNIYQRRRKVQVSPYKQQQRQSIQFQSTKLNQFSPSFNAQLSPACNSHTVNRQSQLKPHARKQSSTKFTIKLQGVLIFSVATHAKQSASCTTQQIIKSMKTRTHGQPTVSAKQAQRKQRNTKCVNCNCILMQSIKTQPQ